MSFDFLKSKIFFIFVFVIILLVGGFFYWQSQKPTPPEKWDTAEVSGYEDFEIKTGSKGKIVENENVDLDFVIPSDWSRVKGVSYNSFLSPKAKRRENNRNILEEGCRLSVKVSEVNTNIKKIEETQREKFDWSSLTMNKYKSVDVDDKEALKHTFHDEKMDMHFIGIHLPFNQRLYEFVMDAASSSKQNCKREFDNILDTISIK